MTHAQVCAAFDYDRITGVITHKIDKGKVKTGSVVNHKRRGYIVAKLNGVGIQGHQLAWFIVHGVWIEDLDHENGIKHDNRLINLRISTRQQQCANTIITNSNKYPGIHKHRQLYSAEIRFNYNRHYLGLYSTRGSFSCVCRGSHRIARKSLGFYALERFRK